MMRSNARPLEPSPRPVCLRTPSHSQARPSRQRVRWKACGDADAGARHFLLVQEIRLRRPRSRPSRSSEVRGRTGTGSARVALHDPQHRGALQLGLAVVVLDVHRNHRDPVLGYGAHDLVADLGARRRRRRQGRRAEPAFEVALEDRPAVSVGRFAAVLRLSGGQRDGLLDSPDHVRHLVAGEHHSFERLPVQDLLRGRRDDEAEIGRLVRPCPRC